MAKDFVSVFIRKSFFYFLGGGGKVQYYKTLPDIFHDDSFEVELIKQIFSKELKWKFEQEYRTHNFFPHPATTSDRQVVIPSNAFKEIIFGFQMTEDVKDEIKETCQIQGMNVDYKQCISENGEIKIKPLAYKD